MTTTLRPTGPIQSGADGAQRRAYDICDNGRPVGFLALAVEAGAGGSTGLITELRVDEAVRRRGRGTIAVLAAEEILRGWGCALVCAEVPADDTVGLRMATALGYTERSRNMLKTLPAEPPALPDGLVARPMTPAQFTVWSEKAIGMYAGSLVSRGIPREVAHDAARASHARHLPDGLATAGARFDLLFRAEGGESVGDIWESTFEMHPGLVIGYVFNVEVAPEHRGRGYGRALMLQAERMALAAGETRIGLHVITSNTPALRLYESLGYEPTQYNFSKEL
ncbi:MULTISPECIES: GNAT family N-acetyltransferase [unclassified Streptomyces]|uniref:GNAT family N-acetyltransferase n=1 Tax=unclassified Streptomyces TaxID=2593676 RepID=UPI000DACA4EB|nr:MULTISPECIES: GNAT family N-acetyltransferase [unclassified Streptomyces]PZT74058.1 GNAT family N-acetyltransferase [Streptomyces sp. AC1-42T]PZT82952.1 GNAT family N-acetyltransferase [Streptomyces sp. AC1-42W]